MRRLKRRIFATPGVLPDNLHHHNRRFAVAFAVAVSLFVSPAFAGQNFKPRELPETGPTEAEISEKADCLIWFTAEYVGNPLHFSAETVLRRHREKFRKARDDSREAAELFLRSTQPNAVLWILEKALGDISAIRYAYQKCFVENEEPGELGLD